MGYWEDRLDIPVASDGETASYDLIDGPTTLDPTTENPAVNWLDSVQTIASLVDNNMGKVGPLADRPAPGPDAPILFFTTDSTPPRWTLNAGTEWVVAGESTDAATLGGKAPAKYLQTDAPASVSVVHEYTAAGGIRFGDDADSAIEYDYDQTNNELHVRDTLNNRRLWTHYARAGETRAQFGLGAGPHIFRFGNDTVDSLSFVYRTAANNLNIEDDVGTSLFQFGNDGTFSTAFQADVGGKITGRGTSGLELTQGGIIANGDLQLNSNEAKGMIFEQRTSDPASPAVGRVWYRSDL